jgi:hypothetical protein
VTVTYNGISIESQEIPTMPDILATVTLQSISGVPADDCVNNLAFSMPGGWGTSGDLDGLTSDIESLFDQVRVGQQNAMSAYVGDSISRAAGKA